MACVEPSDVGSPTTPALAIALDTLVEGVHFPPQVQVEDLAVKALVVNLSDLAAMGAVAISAHYSLALDRQSPTWVEAFDTAIRGYARPLNIDVTGQVTRVGALSVCVQAIGTVPSNGFMTRAGACAGDAIMVTGTLGDAALGLAIMQGRLRGSEADEKYLMSRLNVPSPRLQVGVAIRDTAHCAIDISDGLLADLGHILEQSRCGATLRLATLPISKQATRVAGEKNALEAALSGGDDYELCFTCEPQWVDGLRRQLASFGCDVSCIGRIDDTPGLRCFTESGEAYEPSRAGWQHFT